MTSEAEKDRLLDTHIARLAEPVMQGVPKFAGEVLQLGEQTLRFIIWEDHADYEKVDDIIVDHGRWSLGRHFIFKRISDGKLFCAHWRKGATEYQEHEYPAEAHEVRAVPVTTYRYERV